MNENKTSAHVEIRGLCLHFPVLFAGSRSLKNEVMQSFTGGRIGEIKGHRVVHALQNVNLSIESGERVGVVGHNGAGKTTLLRVLNGIYPPTSGSVRVEGRVGSLINVSLGIDPGSTGKENIFIRSALMGIQRSDVRLKYDGIVETADLGDFIDMPVKTYSSGMATRLAFAIATAYPADILLMDEWLSAGDVHFRKKASGRMESLTSQSGILILASHSPATLKQNCSRLVWLERGEVRMDGPVDVVAEEYFDRREAVRA
jgi:lipopolysaccharide transport system ATP-binding protein